MNIVAGKLYVGPNARLLRVMAFNDEQVEVETRLDFRTMPSIPRAEFEAEWSEYVDPFA